MKCVNMEEQLAIQTSCDRLRKDRSEILLSYRIHSCFSLDAVFRTFVSYLKVL